MRVEGLTAGRELAKRWSSYRKGNLVDAYRRILSQGAQPALREIFLHILTRPTAPLLVHCTAGKDRTGVAVALALTLAGVEDEVVAEEYALTTQALAAIREKLEEKLAQREAFRELGEEERKGGLGNMLSSKKESMVGFLEMLRAEFGGVEKYLEERCGFSKEEVERIRENLVQREE